jgi:hypothetical protein
MHSLLRNIALPSALIAISANAAAEPAPDGADSVDLSDVDAAFAEGDDEPLATTASATPRATTQPGAMNPDIAVILDVAGAYFSNEEHRQTGGHDPSENGFNLQQLELSLGSAVDPYFRFDSNIVFSLFGVEVEEAYATTLDLPGQLQLRAGQFLSRFGRINATHPHSWDFVDQPFALGRVFGGEGGRGLGVESSWLLPLPWFSEAVASVQQADGEANARSFYGARDLGVEEAADLLYVTALKQVFELGPDWSLAVGASGAFGPNSTGRENRTDVFGADLYLKYRPITKQSSSIVSLQTEWLLRRRQVPEDLLYDLSSYSQLFWRFAPRWGTAVRWEYGSPAEGVSGPALDPLDPEWTRPRQRQSANVTFWPTEFSRLRLQGSRDDLGFRDAVWAAFLAAEFVVGAHGAHTF